ncbi:hypothetical protein, partial [Streptomyces violascens]|uniref:hypothetical protein n=1 Tax=Streptomyces violascens TaxID=67381 RepID=UPI0036BA6144
QWYTPGAGWGASPPHDVDALIEQLESEFEDSQLLTMSFAVGTEGCTKVATCTGSCPCGTG